ncbi:hypothetical protein BDL97_03G077500 [Sphagnum fallax]|nr:hypothetical protein BDL97_03G077500 [Sphagnum fallax]KAH8967426.1 hypothetical protein BDL97_03G077500 [Sphagnum fallax]
MKRPRGSPLSNPGSWSYSQNRQVICDSGSGNNWARGFYVHGPRCRDSILDIVRLEVEECDRFGGFVTMQSMGGGTGSGLGTYISEALRDEYPTTCILSNCIWPHESGEVIVQSYNVLLTLSYLESLADGIVILQNEGLTSICKKLLGIQRPSFDHMNEVAAESLVSVLLPAFWRPVEATLSPQKENTHRLTHPIIQTGDNKPNNSGKFVASSHLHLLSDLVSVLCAHPAYRLLSLRFTPQVPPQSLDFTTFTWGAHMKQLRHMLTMGAWGDTDINWSAALSTIASSTSKVSSQPGLRPTNRSVSNLLILRGNGSQHADVNTFAHESLYPIWSVDPLNVAVNETKLGNYEMAAGLLSNCQSTVMPASRVLPRAYGMYSARAYLHQYFEHGMDNSSFDAAFATVEDIVARYLAL